MPLLTFENKEMIPTDFHGEVKEKDGKFEVNLSLTSKVTEFRENNTTVVKERDAALSENAIYKNIIGEDVDAFSESLTSMRTTQQQVDDGKLTAKSDIETELGKRTEAMKELHVSEIRQKDGKINEQAETISTLGGEIKRNTITHAVQQVINSKDSGIQPTAAGDIASRAMGRFTVDGGEVVAKNTDGSVIYGQDGTTPESVTEWIDGLKKSSPHFFVQSSGGGGQGGSDTNHGGMAPSEFAKLSGKEKLKIANKNLRT